MKEYTVHETSPILRQAHDPGPEYPAFVREERIAMRSKERHESRVKAAEWAFVKHYLALKDETSFTLNEEGLRTARTVAALEIHGIGGIRGYSGGSTARMPWASSLGKGRKQAMDGASWDGAIREAFEGPYTPTISDVKALITFDDEILPWVIAYASYQAVRSMDPTVSHAWDTVRKEAVLRQEEADEAVKTRREAARLVAAEPDAEPPAIDPTPAPGVTIELVQRAQ